MRKSLGWQTKHAVYLLSMTSLAVRIVSAVVIAAMIGVICIQWRQRRDRLSRWVLVLPLILTLIIFAVWH
jgi:hypothetical protein